MKYEQIQTKENYEKLLKSGMFWEFHPELTGDWVTDREVILVEQEHLHIKSEDKP